MMTKLEEALALLPTDNCVPWPGHRDRWGYGRGHRDIAHRRVYETVVGPIPDGAELDHLCHTLDAACPGGRTCVHRACVNPAHLEPVTRAENVRRGVQARQTHCTNGHAYTAANTYRRPSGQRDCRTCVRDRVRAYKLRVRGPA